MFAKLLLALALYQQTRSSCRLTQECVYMACKYMYIHYVQTVPIGTEKRMRI